MTKKSRSAPAVASVDDWQARDDFETLMRAAQIRKDKRRFNAARAVARERVNAAAAIAD